MTLNRKVALVTGSSEGLGHAILEGLTDLGADAVVNYHRDAKDADAVRESAEAKGVRAVTVQADASNTGRI